VFCLYFSPFSGTCFTINSYSNLLFLKYIVAHNLDIPILEEIPLAASGCSSIEERSYVGYIASTYSAENQKLLYHALSERKQKKVKIGTRRFYVDFFDPISGLVRKFLGCAIHVSRYILN
jgi:hypothetical protein